jgi:hypothetical protein
VNIEPVHHHEPRGIGHKWFDAGITIAILLISASSLIVAVVHSSTLEKMADANARLVEANSWPFLSYDTSNGQTISMSVVNDGIGPAKIEAVEVKWAGRAQRNADEFLKACCGFVPGTGDVGYQFIAGKVLRAGQSLNILTLDRSSADAPAWKALDNARLSRSVSVNVCYCSIFDQCWKSDVARISLTPHAVHVCTAPTAPYGLPD